MTTQALNSSTAIYSTPQSKFKQALGKNLVGYIFLTPWLIGFFVFTIGPMIASLYLSMTEYDLISNPNWVGFANYTKLFQRDFRYEASVIVTAKYVLFSVPLKIVFALGVAMLLNRKIRGISVYRAVFYLPSILGGSVAISLLWRELFGTHGQINDLLASFGIQGRSWISHPDYALDTLVVLALWQFGSPMIIFLAALKQIPQHLYEAAQIDGANRVHSFLKITLPLLTPIIFFNFVMQMIGAFQAFTPAFIISGGKGGPIDSTLFYTLYLYQKGFAHFQMGYASAMAWVLMVIIAVFTAITFWTSKFWVFYNED